MASEAMQSETRDHPPGNRLDRPGESTQTTADRLADYSQTCETDGKMKAEALLETTGLARLDQMMSGMINEIVGGIFAIALGLVLLNQLFSVSIVDTANGSFAGTFSTVESVGGAALTFAVLGMLALAGGTAVRMFRT